jgi:peptidoglycan/xylan/chitin deacetylase (PgdA/CDA1 family)
MKSIIKESLLRLGVPRLLRHFAPAGAIILQYHSVHPDARIPPPGFPCGISHPASAFDRQMELLATQFDPVTLDDILHFLHGQKRLPRRAVAITFDDGFKDNFEVAAPILARYGLRATFYITAGSVGGRKRFWFCRLRHAFHSAAVHRWTDPVTRRLWDLSDIEQQIEARRSVFGRCASLVSDRREEVVCSIERDLEASSSHVDDCLMMDWSQVRALREAGHIIGSHTLTHPNLAHVSLPEARHELEESKRILEEQVAVPIVHFSYPNPFLQPHFTEETVLLTAQCGYLTAVTSTPGRARSGHSPLALPRVSAPVDVDQFRWVVESRLAGCVR